MGFTRHPLMMSLRTLAFYFGFVVSTVVWGSLGVLVGWLMPFRARFIFIIVIWTRMVIAWLRITCGVRVEVRGLEHIPKAGACVVVGKHESTFESLYLQRHFAPVATVIKRELLLIPFFGWAFWLLRPIAINRSRPTSAIKEVFRQGKDRLTHGMSVVLFPEGTRGRPGELGEFTRSAAALAIAAGVPTLPVFINSGTCWPVHSFLKRPGTITVWFGPPIATAGKKADTVNKEARDWIATTMRQFEEEADE